MRTSYDDADPRVSCFRKRAFGDEKKAKQAAAKVNSSPSKNHDVVPYVCFHCGSWHIGRGNDEEAG